MTFYKFVSIIFFTLYCKKNVIFLISLELIFASFSDKKDDIFFESDTSLIIFNFKSLDKLKFLILIASKIFSLSEK